MGVLTLSRTALLSAAAAVSPAPSPNGPRHQEPYTDVVLSADTDGALLVTGIIDDMTVQRRLSELYWTDDMIAASRPVLVRSGFDPIKIPAPVLGAIPVAAGQVSVERVEDSVVITTHEARFYIREPAQLEKAAEISLGKQQNRMPAGRLGAMLGLVESAMSRDEIRYYLNGVYLHFDEGRVVACATDGHRMSMASTSNHGVDPDFPGTIIPRSAALWLVDALACADDVVFSVDGLQVVMRLGDDFAVAFKAIDGTYPNYRRLIPSQDDGPDVMTCKARDLLAAVEPAAARESKWDQVIALRLGGEGGATVQVETRHDEDVCSKLRLDAAYTGAARSVGFNPRYVADMLRPLIGELSIRFHKDPAGPNVFTSDDEPDWLGLIMPLRSTWKEWV